MRNESDKSVIAMLTNYIRGQGNYDPVENEDVEIYMINEDYNSNNVKEDKKGLEMEDY